MPRLLSLDNTPLGLSENFDKMLDLQEYPRFRRSVNIIESVRNNINLLDDNAVDQCGNYEDGDNDTKMAQFVSHLVLNTLRKAKDSREFSGKLLIPSNLPDHVARDVLIMAREEPCGVRGCSLDIVYEDGNMCKRFGRVAVDPDTVTTFEITVILGRDSPKWFLSKMQSVLRNSGEQTVLKSCYKLVKTKLYRRNSSLSIKEGS
ncbi:DNA damage-inducible transcript 4-like protein [Diadema setosum]|uniref:DNA damage-inducible transcript 4-like protein n=1 Tax=Diadema setosum TaxID=31175 RepID=UPI003B3A99A7